MSTGVPHKRCPRCQAPAALDAPQCAGCGHQFRTRFVPPADQTQMYGAPTPPPQPAQVYPPSPPPPNVQYAPPSTGAAYQPGPTWYGHQPDTIYLPPGQHSIALVVVLSLLCGGWLGMLVNRQTAKGLTVLGGLIVLGVGSFILSLASPPLMVVMSLVNTVLLVALIADPILVAVRLNRGEPVRPWQWF